ncbi:MAG: MBL fold metallo-hydrolase [Epsilonproteobacteria bacterium]|nr:MBL fold metallo-hydrolase [Campylobacterota bacterium]
MEIKFKPMGVYATNCYILTTNNKDIIIDPGVDATNWVLKNVKNPVAILNTHGHFDHIWSNSELSKKLNIPIYCPKDDAFMLENDPFNYGTPKSKASFLVEPDSQIDIEGVKLKFWHFPGHTPGCSVIEYNDIWFSGDFLFKGSIGRWDFPYSNKDDMVNSLYKVKRFKEDKKLLPGHGEFTTLKEELKNIDGWIRYVKNS